MSRITGLATAFFLLNAENRTDPNGLAAAVDVKSAKVRSLTTSRGESDRNNWIRSAISSTTDKNEPEPLERRPTANRR
jgi:hypothetical protein